MVIVLLLMGEQIIFYVYLCESFLYMYLPLQQTLGTGLQHSCSEEVKPEVCWFSCHDFHTGAIPLNQSHGNDCWTESVLEIGHFK